MTTLSRSTTNFSNLIRYRCDKLSMADNQRYGNVFAISTDGLDPKLQQRYLKSLASNAENIPQSVFDNHQNAFYESSFDEKGYIKHIDVMHLSHQQKNVTASKPQPKSGVSPTAVRFFVKSNKNKTLVFTKAAGMGTRIESVPTQAETQENTPEYTTPIPTPSKPR